MDFQMKFIFLVGLLFILMNTLKVATSVSGMHSTDAEPREGQRGHALARQAAAQGCRQGPGCCGTR
jgi:hypothetical protein